MYSPDPIESFLYLKVTEPSSSKIPGKRDRNQPALHQLQTKKSLEKTQLAAMAYIFRSCRKLRDCLRLKFYSLHPYAGA